VGFGSFMESIGCVVYKFREEKMDIPKRPSLLYKDDIHREQVYVLEGNIVKDLGIDDIDYMFRNTDRNAFNCMKLLSVMQTSGENIAYRSEILEDFMQNKSVRQCAANILMKLIALKNEYGVKTFRFDETHKDILWKFSVMQSYVKCIKEIREILEDCKNDVKSEGLQNFIKYIDDIYRSESYKFIVEKLPEHQKAIDNMKGITVGINMNKLLEPTEAMILTFEPKPFKKRSFLSDFFQTKDNAEEILKKSQFYSLAKVSKSGIEAAFLKDLGEVIRMGLEKVAELLDEYFTSGIEELLEYDLEIDFYMAGYHLVDRAQEMGIPMTRPEVADKEERICEIENTCDISLAVRMRKENSKLSRPGDVIVKNDVAMNDQGRIFIITGPNQGGKTTYTRAIGMAQVLFQAGLYVPGTKAKMSPVDKLFTHFPKEEERRVDEGRLGEELRELSGMMDSVTRYSMVLLNESLSSTSAYDSLVICANLMKAFRSIGLRVVFSTHLHELAYEIDNINSEVEGSSTVIGLVSQIKKIEENGKIKHVSTYKIIPAVTDGKSYAYDIAYKYGMAYEQLMERFFSHDNKRKNGEK
jgi:DNA mismatch repair protein MutS